MNKEIKKVIAEVAERFELYLDQHVDARMEGEGEQQQGCKTRSFGRAEQGP